MHTPFGPFIILSKVDSTNNYAMAKLHAGMLEHGTALLALEQTSGKGQRGKQWISAAAENITMSTVFSLQHSLSSSSLTKVESFPFLLSASVALSCYDFIKAFAGTDISIKWPNDIYLGDRKAGGILIENIIRSGMWLWCVAGTGINVNQTDFGALNRPAASIAQVSGEKYDVLVLARRLHTHLAARFGDLDRLEPELIMASYNQALYKRNKVVHLRSKNILFSTTIREVNMGGQLITEDTLPRTFDVGEVEFA